MATRKLQSLVAPAWTLLGATLAAVATAIQAGRFAEGFRIAGTICAIALLFVITFNLGRAIHSGTECLIAKLQRKRGHIDAPQLPR